MNQRFARKAPQLFLSRQGSLVVFIMQGPLLFLSRRAPWLFLLCRAPCCSCCARPPGCSYCEGLSGCSYRAGPFVVLIAQGVPGCSYRAGLPGRSYRAGALVALIAQGSLVVLIAQCFRHWFSSDVPRGSGIFSIDPSIAIMIGVLNNKRPLIRSSKAFRTKMNKNE